MQCLHIRTYIYKWGCDVYIYICFPQPSKVRKQQCKQCMRPFRYAVLFSQLKESVWMHIYTHGIRIYVRTCMIILLETVHCYHACCGLYVHGLHTRKSRGRAQEIYMELLSVCQHVFCSYGQGWGPPFIMMFLIAMFLLL